MIVTCEKAFDLENQMTFAFRYHMINIILCADMLGTCASKEVVTSNYVATFFSFLFVFSVFENSGKNLSESYVLSILLSIDVYTCTYIHVRIWVQDGLCIARQCLKSHTRML